MPATAKTTKAPKPAKPATRARTISQPAPNKPFPKLMPVPQAAKILGVSNSHIYRLMADGSLSYLVIGKLRKISEHDIWVYLRRARRNVNAATTPSAPDEPAQPAPAVRERNPKQPDLPHTEPVGTAAPETLPDAAPGRDSFEEWPRQDEHAQP